MLIYLFHTGFAKFHFFFGFLLTNGRPKNANTIIEDANKHMQAAQELVVKVGAQVMLICNMTDNLVNGSRGVVTGYDNGFPIGEYIIFFFLYISIRCSTVS